MKSDSCVNMKKHTGNRQRHRIC